jgi:hypothetical protein
MVKEFPLERKITMSILLKKLFPVAASVVIGAAVIQPATLPAQTSGIGGDGVTGLLRYTVMPGISTPIFVKTLPGATCRLREADKPEASPSLKLFADDEGIICFHVRPSIETEQVARFVIDSEVTGGSIRRPLELRANRKETSEMPFPARERPPRQGGVSVRPALMVEEALRLSNNELLQRGYPPRPDAKSGEPFRTWLRIVSVPATRVEPHIVTNTGVSHGLIQRATGGSPASGSPVADIARVGNISYNWSGFELRGGPFQWVYGDWHVPGIYVGETPPSGSITAIADYSAEWVGIDGDGTSDLVQAGTEQDLTTFSFFGNTWSVSSYYAWTQFLPQQANEQRITSLAVNPDDEMSVYVVVSGGNAYFVVQNLTINKFVEVITPLGNTVVGGTEVEWIMERPTVNGSLPDLALYLFSVMSGAVAGNAASLVSYQGTNGTTVPLQNLELLQITMENQTQTDLLSQVTGRDGLSMFFQWFNFH